MTAILTCFPVLRHRTTGHAVEFTAAESYP
jgi:hypothetical protein